MDTVEAIKQLFLDTGTSWVLWLLFALSIASVAVTIERWLLYRRVEGHTPSLAATLHQKLRADQAADAATELGKSPTVAARVAAAGLQLRDRGADAVDKAMHSRLALEREDLDRKLAFLGTLGNNAPFLGLFGTVIGVIQAFEELGHGAAGHGGTSGTGGAAGHVASAAVMSAIAEALVATAVGIAIALPAVAAYNYLQRRVASILAGTEALSNLVLAYVADEQRSLRSEHTEGAKTA